jgi:class 3 adenylate cyclase
MAALRRATARRVATLIRSDPENAATALEIGLVDQEWLDAPSERPISLSTPTSILRRFLDGLLCTFPDPAAGVHAALQLLPAAPTPLRLRAGVHTRDDVFGRVVNVAARVCEAAKGGPVLVSDDVREAAGARDGVRFGRAGRGA